MRLNPNHQQDGEEAWNKSGLVYGQEVLYKGKKYMVIGIGYGMLFKDIAQIDNGEEILNVRISDLEELK